MDIVFGTRRELVAIKLVQSYFASEALATPHNVARSGAASTERFAGSLGGKRRQLSSVSGGPMNSDAWIRPISAHFRELFFRERNGAPSFAS